MIRDSDIRRSVDEYVKRRIREASIELPHQIHNVTKIWKCINPSDFLYGFYLGKIEEGATHYLLKATRIGTFQIDPLEIREIIETHKIELHTIIDNAFDKLRSDTNTG